MVTTGARKGSRAQTNAKDRHESGPVRCNERVRALGTNQPILKSPLQGVQDPNLIGSPTQPSCNMRTLICGKPSTRLSRKVQPLTQGVGAARVREAQSR